MLAMKAENKCVSDIVQKFLRDEKLVQVKHPARSQSEEVTHQKQHSEVSF